MEKYKVVFTGNLGDYYPVAIALLVLSILTAGILLPVWVYWSFHYFLNQLEIIPS